MLSGFGNLGLFCLGFRDFDFGQLGSVEVSESWGRVWESSVRGHRIRVFGLERVRGHRVWEFRVSGFRARGLINVE